MIEQFRCVERNTMFIHLGVSLHSTCGRIS